MSDRAKIAEFVSFCIEAYAKAKGISGAEACARLAFYGAIGYLDRGYGVLHTMAERWLVDDLDGFLAARGYGA